MVADSRAGRARAGFMLCCVLAAGMVAPSPVADAGTMFFLNGTDPIPFLPPPVKSQSWLGSVFDGHYSNDTRVNVDYPASLWPLTFDRPTMGRSVQIGVRATESLVTGTDGEVAVVGISQGALVVDALAGQLAATAGDSLTGRLHFIAVADPNRRGGIFTLLPAGTYIPILDLTNTAPEPSPYDTTVLVQQYDGVADFPDRPWNMISVANALMGVLYYHVAPDWYLHVELPTSGGTSTTNPLGGVTTTYLIPSPHLPLTQPLRDAGVPAALVDRLDRTLRPVVDAGYSDLVPGGPHIEYGRIVSTGPTAGSSSPQRPLFRQIRGAVVAAEVTRGASPRPCRVDTPSERGKAAYSQRHARKI